MKQVWFFFLLVVVFSEKGLGALQEERPPAERRAVVRIEPERDCLSDAFDRFFGVFGIRSIDQINRGEGYSLEATSMPRWQWEYNERTRRENFAKFGVPLLTFGGIIVVRLAIEYLQSLEEPV